MQASTCLKCLKIISKKNCGRKTLNLFSWFMFAWNKLKLVPKIQKKVKRNSLDAYSIFSPLNQVLDKAAILSVFLPPFKMKTIITRFVADGFARIISTAKCLKVVSVRIILTNMAIFIFYPLNFQSSVFNISES